MKFIEIKKFGRIRTVVYLFGKRVLSISNNKKYKKIYAKRFAGLTKEEKRYILEYQFERALGYKLDLDHPKSFNEKLQWLKLNYRNPLITKCADKYQIREYIKENLGEELLIPLLGVWDNVNDIDFNSLPNQFVLKVNWGSGQNIIVTDKSKLDIEDTKNKLSKWMKPENNHYFMGLEWGYKNITPKIICEKYMKQKNLPLQDYKWFVFNGKAKVLSITLDSYDYSKMKINYYDENFDLLPYTNGYPNSNCPIEKPKFYNKMLEIIDIIGKNFPFVRVDFYDTGENLYLGELTFYPGNGTDPFEPIEWDYKLGEMLELPKV